jgi:phytoene dehydrogenase-like protein
MTRAVVVGSGPNGLAAAAVLATAGLEVEVIEAAPEVGGGTRTSQRTLPGLLHDDCSGFHPLAVDTPLARALNLEGRGLRWLWPEVQYAHPLRDGRGAQVVRSAHETATALDADHAAYRRIIGSTSERFESISEDFLAPLVRMPRHPIEMGLFGLRAAMPVAALSTAWKTDEGRALFAGVAAHAFRDFAAPMSSAIGVALGAAAHAYGWPVAEGGSSAIARTLVQVVEQHGGRVTTQVEVSSVADLGDADIIMLDVAPSAAARIAGERLPARVRRSLLRWRHGPGSFKVDFAVEDGVPWSYEPARRAGTVHLGGTYAQIAHAEREVARGRMPQSPFVLVGQQYVADPTRRSRDHVPLYAYAHVPSGYDGDATAVIEATIETYAPGFRDRVVARAVRSTRELASENPNYVGGDIVTGLNSARQLIARPRLTPDPYWLGSPGLYLCSAATPPGAGAHGMCGYNAARSALRRLGLPTGS